MTKLIPEQRKVIAWLASTEAERHPKTLAKLAEEVWGKPSSRRHGRGVCT